MSLAPGTKLGRYEIRAKIGEGGMGVVYLAEDTNLDRKVAIKCLPPGSIADESAKKRLIREAKGSGQARSPEQLSHP